MPPREDGNSIGHHGVCESRFVVLKFEDLELGGISFNLFPTQLVNDCDCVCWRASLSTLALRSRRWTLQQCNGRQQCQVEKRRRRKKMQKKCKSSRLKLAERWRIFEQICIRVTLEKDRNLELRISENE